MDIEYNKEVFNKFSKTCEKVGISKDMVIKSAMEDEILIANADLNKLNKEQVEYIYNLAIKHKKASAIKIHDTVLQNTYDSLALDYNYSVLKLCDKFINWYTVRDGYGNHPFLTKIDIITLKSILDYKAKENRDVVNSIKNTLKIGD